VSFKFGDTARVTNIWAWEAKSRHPYELIVEELRETLLWGRFFTIVEILAGVENAYARNYRVAGNFRLNQTEAEVRHYLGTLRPLSTALKCLCATSASRAGRVRLLPR
jgi:hypothetical protein